MAGPIGRWTATDNAGLTKHQQLVDAANRNDFLDVGDGFAAIATPGGRSVIDERVGILFDRRIGVIITPDTPYDDDDPRYSVKVLQQVDTGNADAKPIVEENDGGFESFPEGGTDSDGSTANVGPFIVATHWGEVNDIDSGAVVGTHKLKEDGTVTVILFAFYDKGGNAHWGFVQGGGAPVSYLKLTSDWSPSIGNGNYVVGNPCHSDGSSPGTNTLGVMLVQPAGATSGTAAGALQFCPLRANDVVAYVPTGSSSAGTVTLSGLALPTRQLPICASNRTYLTGNFSGSVCTLAFNYVRGVSL